MRLIPLVLMIFATTVLATKPTVFQPTSSRLLLYKNLDKNPSDIKTTVDIIKFSIRQIDISSRNARINTSPKYDMGSIKSEKHRGLLDYLLHPITPLILLIVFICFLVLYCFYKKNVVSTATSNNTLLSDAVLYSDLVSSNVGNLTPRETYPGYLTPRKCFKPIFSFGDKVKN